MYRFKDFITWIDEISNIRIFRYEDETNRSHVQFYMKNGYIVDIVATNDEIDADELLTKRWHQ